MSRLSAEEIEEQILEVLNISCENVSVNHWVNAIHEDKTEGLSKHLASMFERFAAARLEAYKAEVRKAIEELEGTALSSVSHVAAANYQHREREAKQAIRKKADDIISHLTKKEIDESK